MDLEGQSQTNRPELVRVTTLPNTDTANSPAASATTRERLIAELAEGPARRGFHIAYDLLGSRAEAEDAVQEALARACEALDRLREPAAAEAWFRRVLVNVCLRALRRRRMRRVVRGIFPGAGEPPPDAIAEDLPSVSAPPSEDIVDQIAARADTRRLLTALEHLPAKQRTALMLRYGQELSVGEVADLLGVGHGTAKTHLVRGLRRLRSLMEKMQ